MEITIKQLSEIASVSSRTLRHYHEIGLLIPKRISQSGYRIYDDEQIDKLQQILFYREFEMPLSDISKIVNDESFDSVKVMENHLKKLKAKQVRLEQIIKNAEKTIKKNKGEIYMSAKEKFEGFKKVKIEENEMNYGKEIRSKYGEDTINASNKKFMNLDNSQYNEMEELGKEIIEKLEKAVREKISIDSQIAAEIVQMHKKWLCFTWEKYSAQAHMGVAMLYTDDERFRQYYDKNVQGCAEFLKNAVIHALSGEK